MKLGNAVSDLVVKKITRGGGESINDDFVFPETTLLLPT